MGEADDDERQSKLKLFFMGITEEDEDDEGEEDEMSSCTPKSRTTPTTSLAPFDELQVLELWPMFPQCEHFLPICKFNFSACVCLCEREREY